MTITSTANTRIKQIIKWRDKAKEREKDGIFLVEGFKMFEEAPENIIREVYVAEGVLQRKNQDGTNAWQKKLDQTGYVTVTDDVMQKMSDTKTPQGILTVAQRMRYSEDRFLEAQDALLVLLENLQDPGNLGTILRTAEGAGATGVVMSAQTVDIYNPKTIRATMGSIYRVPFLYTEDLTKFAEKLAKKGIHTYAAHLSGIASYTEPDYREPSAFLIGNEGNGLSEQLAAKAQSLIRIPMEGKVESLNAAVAASLLMYETHRQRLQETHI